MEIQTLIQPLHTSTMSLMHTTVRSLKMSAQGSGLIGRMTFKG